MADAEVSLVIRARDRTRGVLRRVRRGFRRLGRAATRGLAAAAIGGGAAAKAIGESALNLDNAAARLGLSAEQIQAAQRVLAESGISREETVDILQDLSIRAREAAIDGDEAAEAFERLGFTRSDLQGSPLDILERIQERAREAGIDLQGLNQILDQIGGDAAVDLSRALRQPGNIGTRIQQIADGDLVRSNENVASSAELTRQAMTTLDENLARAANAVENNLPVVAERVDGLTDTIENLATRLDAFVREQLGVRQDPEVKQAILETAANTRNNEPTL